MKRNAVYLALLITIVPLLMDAQSCIPSAPVCVPPGGYAFQYASDTDFGLVFNHLTSGYEFTNGTGNAIVRINAFNGDLQIPGGGALQVDPNRYAFQFSLNQNYGLYFNAANLGYEFRTADASSVLTIGANSGNVIAQGTVIASGGNSNLWTDAYSWGNHALAGYLASELDGDPNNEIQTITLSGSTLSLSGSNSITLPSIPSDNDWNVIGSTMYNVNSGKTGIGITAPDAKLHVDIDASENYPALLLEGASATKGDIAWPSTEFLTLGTWNDAINFFDPHMNIHYDGTITIYNEIEYAGNNGSGNSANGMIQKNGSSGRDELQLYAGGDAYAANSKGAGIHLYGNSDDEHSGNIAFLTGNTNDGDGRMIITGGGGITSGENLLLPRNLTDTRVTIGNNIFDWVDNENDKGMLNLKDPDGRPALYITATSSTEGEIAVPTGEAFNLGHYNGTTFTSRFEVESTGEVGIGTTSPSERLDVAGNIFASAGDLYTASANGVINAGGGKMNANSNIIADNIPTPSATIGDEDLYIQDVLEIGGAAYKPGGGSWLASSDRRLKRDIAPYDDGLEHVLQIDPVRYKYNDILDLANPEKEYVGIIAQDMLEVAPYMVEEMNFFEQVGEVENGVDKVIKEGTPYFVYDESALTYMLVNAIKELHDSLQAIKSITGGQQSDRNYSEEFDRITALNNHLLDRVDQLENELIEMKTTVYKCCAEDVGTIDEVPPKSYLQQNIPNPFSGLTIIPYFIPEASQTAKLVIVDQRGGLIVSHSISEFGKGHFKFDGDSLSAGTYTYSLFVDGEWVESRSMIIGH